MPHCTHKCPIKPRPLPCLALCSTHSTQKQSPPALSGEPVWQILDATAPTSSAPTPRAAASPAAPRWRTGSGGAVRRLTAAWSVRWTSAQMCMFLAPRRSLQILNASSLHTGMRRRVWCRTHLTRRRRTPFCSCLFGSETVPAGRMFSHPRPLAAAAATVDGELPGGAVGPAGTTYTLQPLGAHLTRPIWRLHLECRRCAMSRTCTNSHLTNVRRCSDSRMLNPHKVHSEVTAAGMVAFISGAHAPDGRARRQHDAAYHGQPPR